MMGADGPAFYDDQDVFATYMASRQRRENPNDTLEKPVVLDLIGAVSGRRILDLGCGDAALGREVFAQGCRQYVGIDGSQNMVAAARENMAGTFGEVILSTIEDWTYPPENFDLVVSRLALHYIEDIDTIFKKIYGTLKANGHFVFSVEHPVITSCARGWQTGTARTDWLVDNYFDTGLRITSWLGGEVKKYHHTVEGFFSALQQAGFVVEGLREAEPRREWFATEETYLRRKRIPLFLIMSARKG
jgi:SAM-dependent methyltransferase